MTERRPGVQSVDRALDILEVLADGRTLGVSEIVRATGLPLGTVHRLLSTLVGRGYVRQDAERRYAVGGSALRLADAGQHSLAETSRGYARQLTGAFGETTNVAVRQGNEMVYVAQSPSPHSLRIFAHVGRRVPMHSTAVGKVILAGLGDDAVGLLRRLDLSSRTPHTLTTVDALRAELQIVRTQGFAIDEEEHELGVRCVAAPVPAAPAPYAALSISGPTERFSREQALDAGPVVARTAAALGAALDTGIREPTG